MIDQAKRSSVSGILLIDKPRGFTSHDVVNVVRRKLDTKRVGHAGTLDPLATGLLIVLVGGATKQFVRFSGLDKEYLACLKLGELTDSGDSQGKIIERREYGVITEKMAREVLKGLEGKSESVPPMVSAIRHKGKRLYQLARKGITVERAPRPVMVYELSLRGFSLPQIEFYLKCSKGTYVRSLGEEISRRLGCVGHISQIRRLAVGPYSVEDAKTIDGFDKNDVRPC